ncbi:MAG: hypothetical protein GX560_04590 [Deinococcales bacterium]|nr:hypothetical protein [Deinococcales bacterium]
MIRTVAMPQRLFIGIFFFLAAVVCAVAPMPLLYRSLGVVLSAYLGFAAAGMPAAYLTALLAPPVGLVGGDPDWLVMLPIVLSGNLLAMIGLEYGWRLLAVPLSPLLLVLPALVAWQLPKQPLFEVALPWDGQQGTWVALHLLVALAGVLVAVYLDRRRARVGTERAEGARPEPA